MSEVYPRRTVMDTRTCDRPCPLRDEGQRWRAEAERLRGELERQREESGAQQRAAEHLREELERQREEAERLRGDLERQREEAGRQAARVGELQAQLAVLQRRVFGPLSEKMPTPKEAIRRQEGTNGRNGPAAQETRRERAGQRAALPEVAVPHAVPEAGRVCPNCGSTDLEPLGGGEVSYETDYEPPRAFRRRHVRETLRCRHCRQGIVTAPPPVRVIEGGHYGPGLLAHIVVAKCADALPLHRQEKQWERLGVPLSRSTLTDLFHLVAALLAPLVERLRERIREQAVVHADETHHRIQAVGKTVRGWMWTFLSGPLIAYVFAASRSGKTPAAVLGTTTGTLVVDAYTGYNRVTTPDGRTRAGCLAHARRHFFDALPTAPEAKFALDRILDVYHVEHDAVERGVVRQAEHLALRRARAGPAMAALREWMDREGPRHPPRSPLGAAIGYARNNWGPLTRFLDDAAVPVDNNAAERALRPVAMGRKAFLFVGHEQAGRNLAGLYSLVATCEACGVNPEAYLADVLIRIQTHPQSRIDELLPDRWTPARPAEAPAGPPNHSDAEVPAEPTPDVANDPPGTAPAVAP